MRGIQCRGIEGNHRGRLDAAEPRERLRDLADRVQADRARPHLVHRNHDPVFGNRLEQVDVGAQKPGQPHRVGRTHSNHDDPPRAER